MKRTVLMPDYYPNFHCLAENCKFTCCQRWHINLTRKDYQRLRKLRMSKHMDALLKTAVKRTRPCITDEDYAHVELNENKFCPLLTKEGLCGLQQECGYTILPDICKQFPRQEHSSPNGIEHVCSTGCEATVHLLIDNPKPIRFITQEDEILSLYLRDYTNTIKEYPLYQHYNDIQRICIGILQNRNYSFQNRMILLGLALKDLVNLEKSYDLETMKNWIQGKSLFLRNDNSMQQTLDRIQLEPLKSLSISILHFLYIMPYHAGYQFLFDKTLDNLNITVTDNGDQFDFDLKTFGAKKQLLCEHFNNFENMIENMMVNIFFSLQYPLVNNNIWNNYKLFCYYYNFIQFICVGYMDKDYNIDDLVYAFTICSRMMVHSNQPVRDIILDLFKQTNVDSLADMITLIYN